jgi:peptidyl-prolyl cis-trans isomerase B (cyclophilin B)
MICRCLLLAVLASVLPSKSYAAEPAKFDEATRAPYTSVPEKSRNGKSIAEMKKKVQESWDKIVFNKDGKAVEYVVTFSTDAGDFQVEVWPDVAPNHSRSFIALAQAGFYDGLIFHRVIPGFMIQGGCPLGSGSGGPGYCVKQEFNDKPHERGVLSMARAQPKDSAGSQFFVCVDAARFLDKNYTAFGKVVAGLEAVDKIVSADRNQQDRPLEPVTIKSAKVTQKNDKPKAAKE